MAGNRSTIVLTATDIAESLGVRIVGDAARQVCGVNFIERATESDLAFVGCNRNLKRAAKSHARLIIAPEDVESRLKDYPDKTFLLVAEPEAAFLLIAERLVPERPRPNIGVSSQAVVAESAVIGSRTNIYPLAVVGEHVRIGENCDIAPGVVIGDGCVIGDDVRLDPNVVLYPDVVLGSNVMIKACSVIGGAGFGYRNVNGRHELLPHVGNARIEDDVQIGACTTIDRAKVGETSVGFGSRIDNQVMIAHNCQIGKHNLILSQTGIAGSCTTGAYVVCAGQAGIADHVHLGEHAVIGAKTGVHRDMAGGKKYLGIPAREAGAHAREQMSLKRLPEMRTTVKLLEKQVVQLQEQIVQLLAAAQPGISPDSRDAA